MREVTDKEIREQIAEVVKENPHLKKCATCYFRNHQEKKCILLGIPAEDYRYGCKNHVTDEEYMLRQTRERMQKEAEAEAELLPRFSKLDAIDQKYLYYSPPEYRRDFTLEEVCLKFRDFACSRMGLYYEKKVIRLLFAGFASTKLILLTSSG